MAAAGPPTPGGKGFQVRLYNQILKLSRRHSITLITLTGAEKVDQDIASACRKVIAIRWSASRGVMSAVLHAARIPLSVGLFLDNRLAAALSSEIQTGRYDLAHLQLVRMAPYTTRSNGVPVILDLMDAAELNMHERARVAAPGISQLLDLEARRLGVYERSAISKANLSLVVSLRDLAYLGQPPRARVLANGIELQPLEGNPPTRRAATVVFSGTMSYFPNADAAIWFATKIWPLIRAEIPSATCRIVGRSPTQAVKRLGFLPGITVTGAVPQVSAELAAASVAVAPMRLGSGMLTKVLEAMAAGTPVVGTSMALEGIPQDLHPFVRRADSSVEFAMEVAAILTDSTVAMGRAASGWRQIKEHHTWDHSVAALERSYKEAIAARGSTR